MSNSTAAAAALGQQDGEIVMGVGVVQI